MTPPPAWLHQPAYILADNMLLLVEWLVVDNLEPHPATGIETDEKVAHRTGEFYQRKSAYQHGTGTDGAVDGEAGDIVRCAIEKQGVVRPLGPEGTGTALILQQFGQDQLVANSRNVPKR